jgi:hypothetical protein
MGLEEHIKAGAQLTRDTIIVTDILGSGSIELGSLYGILSIKTNAPSASRFRLYETQTSRDVQEEIDRPFGYPVSGNISLVGDFSMSLAGTYTIAPAVFGTVNDRTNSSTYYRLEPSGSEVSITRYLIEDTSIIPDLNTFYSIDNRRVIGISTSSMADGLIISGTVALSTIPTTYMILSASCSQTNHIFRLRLYSTSSAITDAAEATRIRSVEPSETVQLIIDAIVSGSETLYFKPKIFGANLNNMGNDLLVTALDKTKINGERELYYMLQNLSGDTINSPEVLISVYSLED